MEGAGARERSHCWAQKASGLRGLGCPLSKISCTRREAAGPDAELPACAVLASRAPVPGRGVRDSRGRGHRGRGRGAGGSEVPRRVGVFSCCFLGPPRGVRGIRGHVDALLFPRGGQRRPGQRAGGRSEPASAVGRPLVQAGRRTHVWIPHG